MAVFWRLWAIASVTLAIAILIFVWLTLLQFRNVQRTLLTERVAVLAENTAKPFESAMSIGMPLSSVRNAEALLERARQTDDAITAILLVDPKHQILRQVGDDTSALASLAQSADWSRGAVNLFDGGRFVSFNPIAGSGGGSPGAIVVALDASASINRTWAMGAELATAAAAFLGVGILAIGLALRRAFASEIAAYDAVEHDVELFERDSWRGEASDQEAGGEFNRVLNDAYASYRAAVSRAPAPGYVD